ncbi:unnamed protein product [Calypogeia fissa]
MPRPFVPLLRRTLEKISQQFQSTSAPCTLSQSRPLASLSDGSPGGHPRGSGDRLILRGMRFHGKHGVFQEERTLGQKFDVDVDAWMDLSKAGETDNLEDSVSYAEIYSQIKAIVEGPPHFLLESVATAIAKAVLGQHPQISDVRVRVGKPHVSVVGVVKVLGVEIFRSSSHSGSITKPKRTANLPVD